MKKLFFGGWFILFMLCFPAEAQHLNPSDIRISLLTAEQGEELYFAFGHSAIRIRIDSLNYDAVFNYGTFDFNQPNFYINFARGRMLYYLNVEPFDHFILSYMDENRGIREQVFALDSAQTMFVFQFLMNNARPEHRDYLYHFFLDNCATRIRDLMLNTWQITTLPESQDALTYRDLIHRYLRQHPWGRFGIDIALGLPTDKKTDTFEQMFLPDYIFDTFAKMLYAGRPIVKETNTIFVPDQPAIHPPGPVTPTVVCCLVFALAITFLFVQKGSKAFDFMLFFVVGLVGVLVIFLWFFTDHTNTQNNLNVIWALPTHVVMAFFLLCKKRSNFTRYYFLATAMISMLLVVSWVFLPQRLNPSLIPLALAVALRAFRTYRMII